MRLYNVHTLLNNLFVFNHQQIYSYVVQIFIPEGQHFLSSIKAFTHPTRVSNIKPINDQISQGYLAVQRDCRILGKMENSLFIAVASTVITVE